jgi:hypothetical protein
MGPVGVKAWKRSVVASSSPAVEALDRRPQGLAAVARPPVGKNQGTGLRHGVSGSEWMGRMLYGRGKADMVGLPT